MTHDRTKAVLLIATALAIPAEGLRKYAYNDPVGILTVCYGHTGDDVEKGREYSFDECKALLDQDMRLAVAAVERCAPGLPAESLAAFADAVYNLGPKIACNTSASTAARLLKAGDIRGACEELPRWNKASLAGFKVALPGLTKRRAAERELCLRGIEDA
jgi:GH24 family phage-related lysozyme (muramidase)